jgi:hypothetical protein
LDEFTMKLRARTLNTLLAVTGVALILASNLVVLLEAESRIAQPDFARMRLWLLISLIGIVVNQIGVWQLGNKLLPERRVYLRLRSEVEAFLGDVRELNRLTVEGNATASHQVVERMHGSIARMQEAAGLRADGLAPTAALAAPPARQTAT